MTVSAVMLAHQVAGKAVRDALFLGALPATHLPRMVITAAVLSVLAVPLYSHLLAWLGPRRLVPLGFLLSAILHVVEWRWFDAGGVAIPIVVYIHVASFGALLLSGFWSLTSEVFDPHSAREQVVRFVAQERYESDLPVPVLWEVLRAWVRLYGLISLEVTGQLWFMFEDVTPAFEAELASSAAALGLEYAPPARAQAAVR